MYSLYLRSRGLDVTDATDVDDALRRAAEADVIVTGLGLPEGFNCDGTLLIRCLRGNPATNAKPIIVLTAAVFEADRSRAEAAGCTAFLGKPCMPATLLDEISRLIRSRSPLRSDPRH